MRWASTMARRGVAGTVWINTYRAVSYPSHCGGCWRSGIGRESGQRMIKKYLQAKSVWIPMAAEAPNPFIMR
jgi:(Z)-2-((N-methylformamido)methylene)-5-hydroxybutyrolactone dehydrogenase